MSGGHVHGVPGTSSTDDVPVPTRARMVLLSTLAAVGVATVVGLVALWPNAADVQKVGAGLEYAAPGVTFPHAVITAVDQTCPDEDATNDSPDAGPQRACVMLTVRLGADEAGEGTQQVPLEGPVASAGLGPGDGVQLLRLPAAGGEPASFVVVGVERAVDLGWYALAFVVVVALVARLRGLLAIVGLVLAGFVIARFMLPALLTGEPGVAVSLVTASAIMYVVLYLAHGVSIRTSTALAGTLVGIVMTAAIAMAAVRTSHLSGVSDETGDLLSGYVGLDFPSVLMGAIVIAGLGVLNDVTITQTSAVWELRAAAPQLTRTEIFRSAMRIGRDHIASTIYTIVFAYAGAALSVLLLLYLYKLPLLDLLGTEDIATEVARTLCSGIGLVLAVPVTTAIAAATVSKARGADPNHLPAPPATRGARHRRS